jgi:hypothetical protein
MFVSLKYPVPLAFFFFNQTVSHLTAEDNVEQVFSRAGQLSSFGS